MAGNNAIQILRANSATIASSSETLLDGQLLYNTDKNYLTCGGGGNNKPVKSLPIVCRELRAYMFDDYNTNAGSITSNTTGLLSIIPECSTSEQTWNYYANGTAAYHNFYAGGSRLLGITPMTVLIGKDDNTGRLIVGAGGITGTCSLTATLNAPQIVIKTGATNNAALSIGRETIQMKSTGPLQLQVAQDLTGNYQRLTSDTPYFSFYPHGLGTAGGGLIHNGIVRTQLTANTPTTVPIHKVGERTSFRFYGSLSYYVQTNGVSFTS